MAFGVLSIPLMTLPNTGVWLSSKKTWITALSSIKIAIQTVEQSIQEGQPRLKMGGGK